jgi:hypothetical protein
MTHPAIPANIASVGAWDRLAIIALGAAGCALSYDALQQMAVAIHVRGPLTYLFPLVIDGFIAYGVRALLVLSGAPLRARFYVWMLFGTATAASIWANALHAVRLNQQTSTSGLRLGDTVVAILSTIAPLALAGAVHLYILITRHHPHTPTAAAPDAVADRRILVAGHAPVGDQGDRRPLTVPATGPHHDGSPIGDRSAHTGATSGASTPARQGGPVPDRHADGPLTGGDTAEQSGTGPGAGGDRPRLPRSNGDRAANGQVHGTEDGPGLVSHDADHNLVAAVPNTDVPAASRGTRNRGPVPSRKRRDRRSGTKLSEDDIVARIRPLVPAALERDGNRVITRVQLRQIMRDQHISIGNDRLSPVLQRLRSESGRPTAERSIR